MKVFLILASHNTTTSFSPLFFFADLQTLLTEVAGDVQIAATRITEGLFVSALLFFSLTLGIQVTLNNGARSLVKKTRSSPPTSLTKTLSPVEVTEVEEAVVADGVVLEEALLLEVPAQEAQAVVVPMVIMLRLHPLQALQLLLPPHPPRPGLIFLLLPACQLWMRRTVLLLNLSMEKRCQVLRIPLHLGRPLPRRTIRRDGR
jgi:hypothetical protein